MKILEAIYKSLSEYITVIPAIICLVCGVYLTTEDLPRFENYRIWIIIVGVISILYGKKNKSISANVVLTISVIEVLISLSVIFTRINKANEIVRTKALAPLREQLHKQIDCEKVYTKDWSIANCQNSNDRNKEKDIPVLQEIAKYKYDSFNLDTLRNDNDLLPLLIFTIAFPLLAYIAVDRKEEKEKSHSEYMQALTSDRSDLSIEKEFGVSRKKVKVIREQLRNQKSQSLPIVSQSEANVIKFKKKW